ncbi:SCO-spondin-like isoform X2 [Lineus longissimus]|uniref:SCO-spondin-like isoform X2 n=1 Tax=Lineus longissimus TaxID=88925 RepID=UPI00315C9C84
MMLLSSLVSLALLASVSAGPLLFQPHHQLPPSLSKQMCKSGLECQNDDTCCEVKTGGWSCCPFKNATCCKDKQHCCPGGTHCNLTSQHCEKPNQVYPIRLTSLSKDSKVESVVCLDKKSDCPDGNTCCKLASGDYGCCPLPDAMCCSDNVHCCPQGYTCDVQSGSCNKGLISVKWVKKIQAKAKDVRCLEGKCPDNNTCCQQGSRLYGCCPFPNAVCCSDRRHCCPEGFTCHQSLGTCTDGSYHIPWRNETKPSQSTLPIVVIRRTDTIVKGVHCPDGKQVCPDDTTCCQMSTGAYGCCPMPNANCCPDHIHCCPHEQKCDIKSGACVNGDMTFPLLKKFAAKFADVVCPDGQGTCPTDSTCCKLASGKYGCCPLPSATCCDDHIHCCPNGYTCDTAQSTCNKGALFVPMAKKIPAESVVPEKLLGSKILCPDRETVCDEGSTCCMLKSGDYGCCPLKKALCCTDQEHCCPEGYHCDVKTKQCLPAPSPMLKHSSSVSVVICPNKQTCPDGNTCCRLASGDYGCCPRPKAVCCPDLTHCCPNGYTCNLKAGSCTQGALSLPWLEKTKATVKNVVCPDGTSMCSTNYTCCKLASGQYGCCPLPRATCCSDQIHCCPEGYTCDPSYGNCLKGTSSIPWMIKTSGIKQVKRVICPDGSSSCPNGNTCCKLASGQYGCCPMPQATCCSDHTHCCPEGYTCQPSKGTCSKGTVSIPWVKKTTGIKQLKNVISTKMRRCPDGEICKQDLSTCCKGKMGGYLCCRYENATCCPDGIHCCPKGKTCHNLPSGNLVCLPMSLKKVGDVSPVKARAGYIMCPGKVYQCPERNTCCKTATGAYSCCPLPHATCCSDYLHCCPTGYTCVGKGQCQKEGKETIASVKKRPALSIGHQDMQEPPSELLQTVPKEKTTLVNSVVCPDGASQCPSGNTCCKLPSGQYGCCPMPQAVCCSDHVHCCPSGYSCDVSAGTCSKGASMLKWLQKSPAIPIPVNGVVCPDGASQCPSGNTCCKLASGQYGCCPMPQAVCCSDHVHCCPSGYSCDVSAGTCSKGASTLKWLQKSPASPIPVNGVVCPDGASQCPSGNTCCKLASGQYGCCPLPQAVCCSDHVHCCPSGYSCDVSAGTCSKGASTLKWLQKSPASPIPVSGVVCPDGASQCPSGNTCCKLASGQYGCCPLPQAVCCSDHVHCCPNGYSCDVSSGKCNKGLESIPWVEKVSAKSVGRSALAKVLTNVSVQSVICPDKQGTCPDGNTCCLLASGKYGCCPLPQATCCSDHTHCCPHGTTCDTAAGTCNQGDLSLPWYEKKPTTPTNGVVCPDGASQCPDGNTCCKLASGQYGCCPLPQAVCCSDHVHCCPSGYSCDVSAGTCSKGASTLKWLQKSPASPIPVNGVVCPDGASQCPSGNTCCKLASGQYGCCPMPQAVCCSDHVHCCPSGYSCDVSAGTCSKGASMLKWLQKSPATPIPVNGVVCPDGASQCPSGNTCCKLASGQYGCCPLPQAVCCSDHVHCCPSGYSCDVSAGTCSKGASTLKWLQKSPASPIPVNGVVCPDGASQCPSGNTCCKLASGQYGCCPMPQAVCCSDHVHCCPSGYSCDVSAGTCSKGASTLKWLQKSPASPIPVNGVVCPDGASQCPSGNTCCKLASGQYGCCPMPQAVCCSDHVHCCPSGYSCDVSAGTCSKGASTLKWLQKSPASPIPVSGVVCPDGASQCPSGNTCCKLASGQYGCCPLPQAVCCSDHVHCCPNGYSCDVSSGKCNKGLESIPWVEKVSAKSVGRSALAKVLTNVSVQSVICPDKQGTCPDGNTCCLLASGKYGCCPLPQATCCSDHTHCCPHGTTCDTAAGTCNQGDLSLPWYEKKPTTPTNGVVCPDGASQCPDGNTCCKLASGQYGCCPLPQAVCCSDQVHCCPSGYSCDVSAGTCSKGASTLKWLQKSPASPIPVNGVVCPDGASQCPSGNTCCKLASGQYGCCPMPQAVCCSDHVHCCPSGYSCDVSAGTCSKGASMLKWLQKSPATPIPVNGVVCPDGASQCPSGNTCCKLASGQYGCCPMPQAVCCSDHLHCCPSGYSCDVSAGTCSKGASTLKWLQKSPASPIPVNGVVCPDGASQCPSGNTCCKLASGQYGCCPLSQAVCCSDHVHCCPSGYSCDVSAGTCSKGASTLKWLQKSPASPIPVNGVVCPDGVSQCPSGNTCCKLTSGQYGCCPLPQAVCCSDHIHCCPSGYSCDVSASTCSKGASTLKWLQKSPASPIPVNGVVCPDGASQCPSSNTCCKLASGQYGCCPLPQAVCCSDHVHCCPNGYSCDVSSGKCNKGLESIPWLEKVSAKSVGRSALAKVLTNVSVQSVICPDKQGTCPDGNTCCLLASGKYGCCPLPQATCCSDHTHCCPHGTTCDTAAGTCNQGDLSLPWYEKIATTPTNGVVCPDGASQCPDGNTCCKLASGQYGCCPMPQAVCCSDHVHCCPSGYSCDVSAGTCSKGASMLKWLQKSPASPIPVNGVVCPDGASQCPSGNTCCKLASGQYGCCPLPQAVCCSDHVHCCPSGYSCDVSAGTCSKGASTLKWLQKSPASPIPVNGVVCPDGASQCPSGNTCCKLASGQYGCCPMPQAVCCSDHVHCCPSGYSCDVSAGTCSKGASTLKWLQKSPASPIPVNGVVCPDGASQCPSGNTCCKLASGQYGCCPLPQAVCCSDHVHCCPNGYSCDVSSGKCNKGLESIPWLEKVSAKSVGRSALAKVLTNVSVQSVICPDKQGTCPDGNTCCLLASGKYGCCPLPQATCCSDHTHCCPHGTTCDTAAGTCNQGDLSMPWYEKSPATPVNYVPCPDGVSKCPDSFTCCELATGQYGCCPVPEAVCCSGKILCCPRGYTCDESTGTCRENGALSLPWLNRIAAMKKTGAASLSAVICPDGESECPDGNTCCPMSGGTYGCCPLPMAVCCSDKVHCCPKGYTCDAGSETCFKDGKIITLFTKTESKVKSVICPGGGATCPDNNTCCKLASGQYGCCPLPSATCCSDHTHCCPEGYTCHPSEGTCSKSPISLPWLTHELAVGSIICPDKKGTCPDGNTCCLLASGKYGCCPLPQATCCSDHTHCCPHGTTCDTAAGTCNQGTLLLPWLEKITTTPPNGVVCPDGASQCPNGNTCCKLASGQYGCCPLPQAVCCSDHVHCCPNGYSCDVSSGRCNKSFQSIPWVKKSFAKNIHYLP